MLNAVITGRILSVVENFEGSTTQNAIMVEFEQKTFKEGRLSSFRWSIFMPQHKSKWVNTLKEKGYTVAVIIDDLMFFDDRIKDTKDKFTGYAHASEIQTI